jgi:hypothetical protein
LVLPETLFQTQPQQVESWGKYPYIQPYSNLLKTFIPLFTHFLNNLEWYQSFKHY